MNPDTLAFEPAAGRTQFCRSRDDFDNWFGNDNSTPLWHYPLPDRYVRRNPHVPTPPPRVAVAAGPDASRLFPASRTLERFNEPASADRVTSACGPTLYRDRLLGADYYGNAFYCEPAHNLVQRLALGPVGVTFAGRRTPDNVASEFLASTDNWFRPVQARAGPDGALWVVDMHRFVIEHPDWITPDRLAALDLRAGADTGRIYRVYPKGRPPRRVEPMAGLPTAELAARLDNPNGTLRDIVHRELVHRQDAVAAVPPLAVLARSAADPAVQLQAMAALDGLSAATAAGAGAAGGPSSLPADVLLAALGADDAPLRRNAVRLAETRLSADPALAAAVLQRVGDPDLAVRYQVALSLGEWDDDRVPPALARLAASAPADPWLRAAILSSSARRPGTVLAAMSAALPAGPARTEMTRQLAVTLAATAADARSLGDAVRAVVPADGDAVEPWRFAALAAVLDAAVGRPARPGEARPSIAAAVAVDPGIGSRLGRTFAAARATAVDPKAAVAVRAAAIGLLGSGAADGGRSATAIRQATDGHEPDARLLAGLLRPDVAPAVQQAAAEAVARGADAQAADLLLAAWAGVSPSVKPAVFAALVGRREWVGPLVAALEAKRVRAADLSAADQDRLLKDVDPAIRARAEKALGAARPESRSAAVAKARPALALKADPAAGAVVFARACAACHQVGGVGTAVGPNLAAVTDRSGLSLLTAIVDPNAAVDGRFAAYVVETADGRTPDRAPRRRDGRRAHGPPRRRGAGGRRPVDRPPGGQHRPVADARGTGSRDDAAGIGRRGRVRAGPLAARPRGDPTYPAIGRLERANAGAAPPSGRPGHRVVDRRA